MFDPPQDFKEQMAQARRNQILWGAAQVFAEKGYHKSTTKEIAQAASISEGTIYNYFENKRDLLIGMLQLWATESLKNIMNGELPADPKEFLKMVLLNRYQLLQERGYMLAPILAELFADRELREEVYNKVMRPIAGRMEQYLQAQIEAGCFRRIEPAIVTRALIGAMLINSAVKFSGLDARFEDISGEALIEQIVSLFMDGLLTR
jgi:AcrR family transcriptional regulator